MECLQRRIQRDVYRVKQELQYKNSSEPKNSQKGRCQINLNYLQLEFTCKPQTTILSFNIRH